MNELFKPLLAATVNSFDQLKFPLFASPKIDGIRALGQGDTLVSRRLRPLDNKFLQTAFPGHDGLDGELVFGSPTHPHCYERTKSATGRFEGKPKCTWWVFDDFTRPDMAWMKRLDLVREKVNHPWIKVLPQVLINHEDQLEEYESQLLEEGWEGVMLRDPQGRYKFGRSTLNEGILLKLKRFDTDQARIIGFEEEMKNTNPEKRDATGRLKRSKAAEGLVGKGTLGALSIRVVTGPYAGVTTRVTGMTKALKEYIWANREKYLNRMIYFEWFPVGSKDKPRHPTFKDFVS